MLYSISQMLSFLNHSSDLIIGHPGLNLACPTQLSYESLTLENAFDACEEF